MRASDITMEAIKKAQHVIGRFQTVEEVSASEIHARMSAMFEEYSMSVRVCLSGIRDIEKVGSH